MTRGADNVWNRLGAAVLTALCVAVPGFALVDAPALAVDPSPTLSVHVTEGTTGEGASNEGGVQLPQDQEPQSAGAGFVYELIRLDADKVADTPGTQAERTRIVLTNIDDYILLVDGSRVSVLGVSDSHGDITTASDGSGDPEPGTWVSGGTITNGTVDGGTAYQFEGTDQDPQYWYLRLVYHPAGLEIQRSEPGLVALPYVYSSGDSTNPETTYDVNVYPKTLACTDTSLPDGPVQVTAAFSASGRKSATTQSRVLTAGFNQSPGAEPSHPVAPAAYSNCPSSEPPAPTPQPSKPGLPETIVNGIKNGIKNGLSKTGVGIQWIALAVLAFAVVGLITLVLRRRARQGEDHDAHHDGEQPAIPVEQSAS